MSHSPGFHAPAADLQLQFSRYECKYLLTERQADLVRSYVEPYVELDPFAARQPGRRYSISSLYLDSVDLRLLHETLEGLRDRFKLRIRAYSDRPDDPVFFEVKKRRDRKISKERCRVRRSDMLQFLRDGATGTDHMNARERSFFESFVAKARWIDAKPKILVRYEREPYRGRFDDRVRVTFDRQLRGLPVTDAGAFFERSGWSLVEGSRVILELKFDDRHPPWMTEVIRRANLMRISYSKYGHCIHGSYRRGSMSTHM